MSRHVIFSKYVQKIYHWIQDQFKIRQLVIRNKCFIFRDSFKKNLEISILGMNNLKMPLDPAEEKLHKIIYRLNAI